MLVSGSVHPPQKKQHGDGWKVTIFDRRYILIHGWFSIVMLVFWEVEGIEAIDGRDAKTYLGWSSHWFGSVFLFLGKLLLTQVKLLESRFLLFYSFLDRKWWAQKNGLLMTYYVFLLTVCIYVNMYIYLYIYIHKYPVIQVLTHLDPWIIGGHSTYPFEFISLDFAITQKKKVKSSIAM